MTKFNHKSLYLLAALLSFSSTSCSDNDEPEPQPKPKPETVYSVQLTMADKGFDLGDGTQFTPGYSSGDKAGLFAVKDGKIVASNIELTFDGNIWKTDATIASSGEQYYVYTPYKADASSKVTASATAPNAFFADLISACANPGTDQSNFDESVRPFDIAYASATATKGRSETEIITKTLSLTAKAEHALAITSWILPGGTRYTTASGFSYATPGGATAGDVKKGTKNIIPYTLNDTPAFFHQPDASSAVNVAYTMSGTQKNTDITLTAKAGTMNKVAIDGGTIDGGKRELKVGDLYYRDGSVLPVETLAEMTEAPEGVAGVIFCTDPSRFSDDETKLLGSVHALVMSAKMGQFKSRDYMVWSDAYPKPADDGAGRFNDNVEDEKYPGLFLPLIQDRTDAVKSYQINNDDIFGYKYNQIIRTRRSEEIAAGYYPVFSAIDNLNTTVAVNAKACTGWYLPSAGQMMDFMRNIGGAQASADKAEHYPTSTEIADFYFGETGSPDLRANLDASMAKIKTEEKDTYTDSRNAIWTSSYASRYKANTEEFVPSAREFVFDYDVLFVMSYDIIGKGNVRGVLAF